MPKTKKKKGKKKGNKKGSAAKQNGADKIVLSKEQKIQQSICEHIQIIDQNDVEFNPRTIEWTTTKQREFAQNQMWSKQHSVHTKDINSIP